MTSSKEDMIIRKLSELVKSSLIKKYKSLQDTCSEAALAIKKLLEDENFCMKIGLSGALRVERILTAYEWEGEEYRHEYVRIDGIDYDPTASQFDGWEIEMNVVDEEADFPPENLGDDVSDIVESVKKEMESEAESESESEDNEKEDEIEIDGEKHILFQNFSMNTMAINCFCYEADAMLKEDNNGNGYWCWNVENYGWCAVPAVSE